MTIPFWVIDYAQKIELFMRVNGVDEWAIGGIQSRDLPPPKCPPAAAVPEGYALVPVEPPFPKKWIAKGVRVVNGEAAKVWLRYTDEGGGWYQWDTSRSGAKLFDSAEAAIKAAHGCPGPHFHMPAKGSITAEEVESPKAEQYRAMLAGARRGASDGR